MGEKVRQREGRHLNAKLRKEGKQPMNFSAHTDLEYIIAN